MRNSFRSLLYTLAKLLGNAQAVRRGSGTGGVGRRLAGKPTGEG